MNAVSSILYYYNDYYVFGILVGDCLLSHRYSGRVVAVTPKKRVKVKFDEYPRDKYDKT